MRSPSSVLAVMAVLGVLLIALVWFYPLAQDFHPENPFWNGLSSFVRDYRVSLVTPETLPLAPGGTALVMIPRRPLAPGELEAARRYVSGGGRLLLMDDFGWGNQVAEGLRLEARFAAKPLLDPLVNYDKNRNFPTAAQARQEREEPVRVVLDRPTSLTGVPPGYVLASSSRFSFLDLNDNRIWDEGEPTGPLAVAAQVPLGEGTVVLVADPSVLINSMLERNRIFVDVLLGGRETLLYAYNLPQDPLTASKKSLEVVHNALVSPVGLLLSVTLTVLVPTSLLQRRKGV